MAAKLTRLTHEIAILLHLVAESFTICSSLSRRLVRELLDTPSYYNFRITQPAEYRTQASPEVDCPQEKHEACTFHVSEFTLLGYVLDDRGSRVRFPARAGNFSLHHRVQTGSGTHPASYPMGTRGLYLGVKWPGREADHSSPPNAGVKNACSYTSTPPIRLHGVMLNSKQRDDFTVTSTTHPWGSKLPSCNPHFVRHGEGLIYAYLFRHYYTEMVSDWLPRVFMLMDQRLMTIPGYTFTHEVI
jgi:hypothetical protein